MMASARAGDEADAGKMERVSQANPAKPQQPGERYRRMLERGMASYAFDAPAWSRSLAGADPRAARIESLVLATPAVNPPGTDLDDAELVRALVADPAYQLR